MTLKELFPNTFKAMGLYMPYQLWVRPLSAKSSFCRAVIQNGILTHRQMVHAALRYRLGRSKNDAVIYWQIDQNGQVHDGKLMWYDANCHRQKNRNAVWVMYLMKQYLKLPQDTFQATHVFFGTHLLATHHPTSNTVCIVEAEKSAVILSELYPQYIWLAAGGLSELQPQKFWAQKLPPQAVRYLCEDYCIDLPPELQDQEALNKSPIYQHFLRMLQDREPLF